MDAANQQPSAQTEKMDTKDKEDEKQQPFVQQQPFPQQQPFAQQQPFIQQQPFAQQHEEKEAGDDRLVMLCDGVFAIAITLLVIDIKVDGNLSLDQFNNILRSVFFSQTVFYLITFLVISRFWIQHRHLMRSVKRVDHRFIELTFLFLVFISFFPVTSSIVGEGYDYPGAVILYTLTFAGCGFSSLALWSYATWHHRLVDQEITRDEIVARSVSIALTPAYFSLSLLLLLFPALPAGDVFGRGCCCQCCCVSSNLCGTTS